jgi:hypothetical protein
LSAPSHPSDWLKLFRIACSLIDQVNSEQPIIDHWTFGGGTAMMLQIGHRESRDIDIFLDDAQYLGLLNPDKNDFNFEIRPAEYSGDGSHFLKLAFENIGEIDFIIGHAMTDVPTQSQKIEGVNVLLETIPEIIAKKIYYRGASIKSRDIFDIAAAAEHCEADIIQALRQYPTEVAKTLATMAKLNPDFVAATIKALAIKPKYAGIAETALKRTADILRAV